ncbi:MAG TPA: shikimate dehydrogenase [Solirubrobacteraceae bacterium]|nr:shikimate dehydrogenase [Solirubrobacteraceae bacterium]
MPGGALGDRYEVGLIGAGIGESLSPALHEREAREQGLRYRYRLIELEDDDVGALLERARRAGLNGVNVTHPVKQAVVPHLDALSDDAAALQAVNTVVFADGRATGHNTDTTGFAESFARGLPGVALDHVVLLGAGGAGTAVAYAALRLGIARLAIVDVEPERAQACVEQLGSDRASVGTLDDLAGADGLIHATPTGMDAHPGLPLDEDLLRTDLWVAEVVYRPLETELLRAARALGCRTLDGGGMAVFQAADAFALFTGIEPDRERMLRHFAQLVDEPVSTR